MLAAGSRMVLHEYKPAAFQWLIPLLMVAGCLIMSLGIGLPLLLRLPSDLGLWISSGIAVLCGLAMPIGAVLLYLLVPRVTTTLDTRRRVVVMEYRRPIGRSVQEYAIGDIADINMVAMGENA